MDPSLIYTLSASSSSVPLENGQGPVPSSSTLAPPPPAHPTSPPSFQDIDSDSLSDDDEEDWDAVVAAAEAAWTQDQIDELIHYLKEKGLYAFITRYVQRENIPIRTLLLPFGIMLPPDTPMADQIRILKIACSRALRSRDKLEEYNTVDDAVDLIKKSKKILVLTGAGVSTSCGIPDFRSPTGLYARLKEEHWELEDPQEMFDLSYFKQQPNVFYSFAKEIYPSNFTPSPCHRFVKLLELEEKLLRNYTQNIDGLFESVGVKKMLNCHGSFATASCLRCRTQFPGSAIEADVFASRVALCPICTKEDEEKAQEQALLDAKKKPKKPMEKWDGRANARDDEEDEDEARSEWEGKPLVKPDIVFFGEMLSDEFDHKLLEDREEVDLLIVIGTSLRVSPVSQIVTHLPHSIPQILINRDPITHANFDIHLLGDGDTIVRYLASKLGDEFAFDRVPVSVGGALTSDGMKSLDLEEVVPERVGESHVWLFPGSDPEHKWIQRVKEVYGGHGEKESASEGGDGREAGGRRENRGAGESDSSGEGTEEEARPGIAGLEVPSREESVARSRSRTESPVEEEGAMKKVRIE